MKCISSWICFHHCFESVTHNWSPISGFLVNHDVLMLNQHFVHNITVSHGYLFVNSDRSGFLCIREDKTVFLCFGEIVNVITHLKVINYIVNNCSSLKVTADRLEGKVKRVNEVVWSGRDTAIARQIKTFFTFPKTLFMSLSHSSLFKCDFYPSYILL